MRANAYPMEPLRGLVLDILMPHEPTLLEFSREITALDSVDGVTASLIELDTEVQNVEIALEGEDVDFEAITDTIEQLGGTVHSVD